MNDILNIAVEEHNKIRRKHGLPDLKGCPTMIKDAESHAEYLARSNRFETTTMGKYGTNIANSDKPEKLDAVVDCIKTLYDGNDFYDFLHPEVENMGIGIARNGYNNNWVVVLFYDAPAVKLAAKMGKF